MDEWPVGISRRRFLRTGVALGAVGLINPKSLMASEAPYVDLPFARGRRPLVAFPQKRPLMVMTTRPPQLETPFHIFNEHIFTPNDAFFVRWHLANIPASVDVQTFRLAVRGRVNQTLSLSLEDLKNKFEQVEVAAVCQCGGNSRGFFEPRVPGGQWGNGAMGNAKWVGVRLRDVLERAGIPEDAMHVRFDGLDQPVADVTPDFKKSLDLDVAMHPDVLVAHTMNGEPLPLLNGFPLRLVVPGWYATYWIKMLSDIEVLNEPDHNFWMGKAYRLPADPCGCIQPGDSLTRSVPIGKMTVRSFITNVTQGGTVPSGVSTTIKGIAFDEGYGIDRVLFSLDGGVHWQTARLGQDYGDYSFRPWEAQFTPVRGQTYTLQSLAVNRIGESQRFSARWNPSGYLRNAVETLTVRGA
ncbi:molybdopterin-dependent oxidoreductase [Candidatus Nitronereus thalassa]|uniref:Molybdopterin-dependent oxidoreductase n=1 Tax=Candidatus Nitronereus thalassa TaxID=3020898 RepID=A0ABU3K7N5_9BACT|nr:molybdopterin-dependent oxidoreductase [Candidatus Nitronereus thalassa]MDT7042377.1 molybdopterin-dependent oxidoreductase [Candidatus Nitronereus thalassa]